MKNEECRCEKMHSFVASYLHKTGFPNSTQKIREEVRGACSAAVEAGVPIVMSTCDPNSSVGDYNRSALPGSDIDYWTILYSGDSSIKAIVEQSIKSRVSSRMIDMSQPMHVYSVDELRANADIPYDDFNNRFYCDGAQSGVWAAQAIQQLVEGTHLYRPHGTDPIINMFGNSALFKTTPRLECLPRHLKTHVRKRMEYYFPCLSVAEKCALIKLHENKLNGSYDRSIKGPNAHILGKLEELGLVSVVEQGNNRVYAPLWK